MVLFNYAIREITAKLVYYGPGLCGKTTNLQFIHEKLEPGARGKLLSLATDGDRTLFFDFLPIEMGTINGYKVRFQLYTVPGQVHYNATRKLVLKGVDAVVFVADSQVSMLERNRESFENLAENLAENGYEISRVPVVIQLNKRDLPNIASRADLVASMRVESFPVLEAVASRGDGVFETLKSVIKLTLTRLRSQFDAEGRAAVSGAPAPQREAPPAPAPPPPATVFPPPAPAAPAPAVPVAADATPAPVPPALAVAAAAAPPAAPPAAEAGAEQYDEFDLDNYREFDAEAAAPGPAAVFDAQGGEDFRRREPSFGEEAGVGYPDVGTDGSYPREEGVSQDYRRAWVGEETETPAWAVELQEEVRRLRDENRTLREALQGLAGLIERQIDVLREGREQLGGALGEDGGGEGAP